MTGWSSPDLQLHLGHRTLSPRHARQALQQLLSGGADALFEDNALLAASEIVTNAMMHTPDGCELMAWFSVERPHLRVEVTDQSSFIPTLPARPDADQATGRGLRVVAALASAWGIDPLPSGKRVWFELDDHMSPGAIG